MSAGNKKRCTKRREYTSSLRVYVDKKQCFTKFGFSVSSSEGMWSESK